MTTPPPDIPNQMCHSWFICLFLADMWPAWIYLPSGLHSTQEIMCFQLVLFSSLGLSQTGFILKGVSRCPLADVVANFPVEDGTALQPELDNKLRHTHLFFSLFLSLFFVEPFCFFCLSMQPRREWVCRQRASEA